jgi:hypothetical protein
MEKILPQVPSNSKSRYFAIILIKEIEKIKRKSDKLHKKADTSFINCLSKPRLTGNQKIRDLFAKCKKPEGIKKLLGIVGIKKYV